MFKKFFDWFFGGMSKEDKNNFFGFILSVAATFSFFISIFEINPFLLILSFILWLLSLRFLLK